MWFPVTAAISRRTLLAGASRIGLVAVVGMATSACPSPPPSAATATPAAAPTPAVGTGEAWDDGTFFDDGTGWVT